MVRDPGLEELAGKYLYGDFCATYIKSLQLALPAATGETTLPVTVPAFQLVAFGEDACGRVHVVLLADPGKVQRLGGREARAPAPGPAAPVAARRPAAATHARRSGFSLGGAMRQRPLRSGNVGVRVRCGGACTARALGQLSLKLKGRRIGLRQALGRRGGAGTLTLRLRLSAKGRRALRRALRGRRPVRAALTVRVRDASGNLSLRQRTVRLVRLTDPSII